MKHLLVLPTGIALIFLTGCVGNKPNNDYKLADSAQGTPMSKPSINPSVNSPANTSTPTTPQSSVQDTNVSNSSSRTEVDLPSIIDSSSIKFDENFAPIATIHLHNITGREIDQILFRFTFTNHRLSDGAIDIVAASDYSSYVNLSVYLKPPDTTTVAVQVPEPRLKSFDAPNIFITKVRYFDGTIQTDAR